MSDQKPIVKKGRGGAQPGSGRPPGTPNKATQTVREQVKLALGGVDIVDRLCEMAKSNPDMEMRVYEVLMPYCLPKLRVVELKGEIESKVQASEEVKAVAGWIAEMQSEQL